VKGSFVTWPGFQVDDRGERPALHQIRLARERARRIHDRSVITVASAARTTDWRIVWATVLSREAGIGDRRRDVDEPGQDRRGRKASDPSTS